MSAFSDTVLRLLNRYKGILRKNLPSKKKALLLHTLGIKRQQLQHVSEAALYQTAVRVLRYMETQNSAEVGGCHSGRDEFAQYFRDFLSEYRIEGAVAINAKQCASRAIVEAIQLITVKPHALPGDVCKRLEYCLQTIAKYGTREQNAMIVNALKTYRGRDGSALNSLLLHKVTRYEGDVRSSARGI